MAMPIWQEKDFDVHGGAGMDELGVLLPDRCSRGTEGQALFCRDVVMSHSLHH